MEESIVPLQKPTKLSHSRIAAADSSEVWIHSCKTNPVKCNDLDEYYPRKTQSAHEDFKHGLKEQDEGWETTTTSRTKRSRSLNSLEKNAVDEDCLKLSSIAEQTSSKLIECDSSASNSEEPDGDLVFEPLSAVGRKKVKLIKELRSHNNHQSFDDKDQFAETRDYLDSEVEKLHQSSFASDCVDATSSFIGQDVVKLVMVDVQMTVNASPRAENASFVSLTSEAYGVAVIGYPLDVGEIRDGSETLLLSKESVECKLFGDRGSSFDKFVWRKSRTPVCYGATLVSASEKAKKDVINSMLSDGETGLLGKEKPLMKSVKNKKQTNKGKTALKKTCVPVELIFSKILAAVG